MSIDGRQLLMHEFNGIVQNTITVHPPAKESDVDGFYLFIAKLNVLKTILEGRNPFDMGNLCKDILWNGRIKYSVHR